MARPPVRSRPREPALPGKSRRHRILLLGFAAAAVIFGLIAALRSIDGARPTAGGLAAIDVAVLRSNAAYVGSAACADCHQDENRRWQGSQHAVAMQVADERTVLGDFSSVRFTHLGVASKFFREDGAFIARTAGADGRLADFRVRYTFGVYPLQQYLVELDRGRLQALAIAWDARPRDRGGQRWFHLYPSERIDHHDELHWTGRQQNWNYMCADCHSTNLRKNYDAAADSYATRWSEISVGCEACHGPGSSHVELARAESDAARRRAPEALTVALDERRGVAWTIDPATGNAQRSRSRLSARELDVCAQCHSRRGQFSNDYRPGEPFEDHYLPALLTAGLYHPDGQQRDEVYDWGSFQSSRMNAAGVTCGDCHDPHGAALRAPGNGVCAQCHDPAKYDQPGHHFHAPGADGSACASCHMPTETYMVVDPRHDHSFRIPRPDLASALGVPDPCTHCHHDRNPTWAANEIRRRHPAPKPGYQTFATAFADFDRGTGGNSATLAAIAADSAQSAIARASALSRIAARPDRAGLAAAIGALADPNPLVRRAALPVLESLPPLDRRRAFALLDDPVRSVRHAAALLAAPLAADALGPHAAAFERAAGEYVAAERFNADRPENRTNLGGFLASRGDYAHAEAEYRAALQLDPRFVPAWANLADLQRIQGLESEAEATLRAGLSEAPSDANLHHALGLALVRQQRHDEALRELGLAARAAPSEARYAFVYAVALDSVGQKRRATDVLERNLRDHPADRDTLAALADFSERDGNRERAIEFAQRLVDLDPDDPAARQRLRSLER